VSLDYAGLWDLAERKAKRKAGFMFKPEQEELKKEYIEEQSMLEYQRLISPDA
jgi:hypothetical protein